jgi:hypothetical protein
MIPRGFCILPSYERICGLELAFASLRAVYRMGEEKVNSIFDPKFETLGICSPGDQTALDFSRETSYYDTSITRRNQKLFREE